MKAFSTLLLLLVFSLGAYSQCGKADFNASSVQCQGQDVRFSNTSPNANDGSTYSWDFGDGSNKASTVNGLHAYDNPGAYQVVLTRTCPNGQKETKTVPVQISASPTPNNFTHSNDNVCSENAVSFFTTNPAAGMSYTWNFGDGTSTFNQSKSKDTVHIFEAYGNATKSYSVTLTTTDSKGCFAGISNPISVKERPDLQVFEQNNFKTCIANIAAGVTADVTVFNSSTNKPSITAYRINWGDGGGTEALTNATFDDNTGITHTYNQLSRYTITLEADGANGCKTTKKYFYLVDANPVANLIGPPSGTNSGCGPLTVEFINNSNNVSSTTKFFFTPGDGHLPVPLPTGVTGNKFTYTYTSSCINGVLQSLTAKLKAENECDSATSTWSPIKVYPQPIADFEAMPPFCKNVPITFRNISIPNRCAANANTKYTWDFGDGSTPEVYNNVSVSLIPQQTLTHTYADTGTYTVVLRAENNSTNGCGFTTFIKEIKVSELPVADFVPSPPEGCAPLKVTFTNKTKGINLSYNWSVTPSAGTAFTNGTSSASLDPEIEFSNQGSYVVTLIATTPCGTHQKKDTIIVKKKPSITFPTAPAAQCFPASFPETSFLPALDSGGTTITSYLWDFSGGTTSNTNTAHPGTVQFSASGTYPLILTVSNECGSTKDTANIFFKVGTPPLALAGKDTAICSGNTTQLGDTTIPNYTYSWAPLTGLSSASISNPTVTLTNPRTSATVSSYILTVTADGCSNSKEVKVQVNPFPTVSAGADTSVCLSNNAFPLNGATPLGGTWSGAAYISAGGVFNPTGLSAAEYQATYTYKEAATGCEAIKAKKITLQPLPTVEAGTNKTFCNVPIVETLSGYSPLGGTWSGMGVTPAGDFTPSLVGLNSRLSLFYTFTDANACTAKDSLLVEIKDPSPVDMGNDESKCVNEPAFTLVAPNPAGGTWTVQPYLSKEGLFDPLLAGADTFSVTYTSPGTVSCQATGQRIVIIKDTLLVDAGPDQNVCLNEPAFSLSGFSPSGGTWASTPLGFVSGDSFDALQAGSLSTELEVILTYSVHDAVKGCTSKDVKNISIKPVPQVDLSLVPTTFCTKDTLLQLGAIPSNGNWAGNGIIGNAFNPRVAGVGTQQLNYKIAMGNCSDEDSILVQIDPLIKPSAGLDFDICTNAPNKTLTGFSPAGGTWFGTALTGLDFNPAAAGIDTFDLVYSIGIGTCLARDTLKAVVNPLPLLNVGSLVQGVCEGAPAFDLTGWSPNQGGTWSWKGTGITEEKLGTFDPTTSGPGSFILTFQFKDSITSCENTQTKTVNVNALPLLSFATEDSICVQKPFSVSNTSTGDVLTYVWRLIPGTGFTSILGTSSTSEQPSYLFSTSGKYELTLFAQTGSGCTDSLKKNITVLDPPQALFAKNKKEGCGPLSVLFTNQSSGVLTSYQWDFGNGTGSTLQDPGTVVFEPSKFQDTVYYIRLTLFSPTCDEVVFIDSVTVFPIPYVVVGSDKNVGCSPAPILFKNNTSGHPDSFLWDYGDGTPTSTTAEGVHEHFFRYEGKKDTTYKVTLTAFNTCGTDQDSVFIKVLPNTVKAFFNTNVLEGCAPLSVTFTNFSSGGTNIKWELGDGNVSNTVSPTHEYPQPGEYFVRLFVNNGCSFDTTKPAVRIKVHPAPSVKFSPVKEFVCEKNELSFLNQSVDINAYTWEFGDDSVSHLTQPSHIFNQAGNYKVRLTGKSASTQCVSRDSAFVEVRTTPLSSFQTDVSEGCQPLLVNVTNTSLQSTQHHWEFADGNSSGDNRPTFPYTYNTSGSFNLKLYSYSALGCVDSSEHTLVVHPKPVSGFSLSPENACLYPGTVKMTNNSTGFVTSAWDFGNGSTNVQDAPSTIYSSPNTYPIQLISTSDKGCKDTATHFFYGFPQPLPQFTATPVEGCEPLLVHFQNTSQFANTFLWDFGDGSPKTTQAHHVYTQEGTYTVKLVATGNGVCTDSLKIVDLIHVIKQPDTDFTYTNNNDPVPHGEIQFSNLSTDAISYWWDFGDGAASTDQDPVHRYKLFGKVPVTLIAQNDLGCYDTSSAVIVIDFYKGLWVPTALSPENGNEEARMFLPKGRSLKRYKLQIFDNWGILIWESEKLEKGSPAEGWDGKGQNGTPMPPDVYVWKVTAEFEDGTVWEGQSLGNKKAKSLGTVTLIR